MVCRLVVGEKHVYAVLQEKSPKYLFVFSVPSPVSETCSKLTEHDERHCNFFSLLQERDGRGDTLAKIDVSIGVQRDLHLQRPLSTRSCAVSTVSRALSGLQVPAISARLRRFR